MKIKKIKKIKLSIKSKIICSFCLLVILMLIAQIVFNVFLSKEVFIKSNLEDVETLFYKIQSSYDDDVDLIHEMTVEELLVDGFSIDVFSETEIIYSTTSSPQIMFNDRVAKTLIESYMSFSYSVSPTANLSSNVDGTNNVIYLFGEIEFNGESRYIIISKMVESIDNSIELFTKTNMIISSFIIVVGVIIIIIMARQISSPIKKIETVSEKIAMLDFSYYANENSSTKEFSSLAKSINSMSSQLDKVLGELMMANVKLTEDVEYQMKIQEERKQFIANISHEMKTPLALLQLYSENLNLDIDGIDKTEYINTIIEEVARLDVIVTDMLNISSIENGFAMVRKEYYDISESILNVVNSMSGLLEDFNLKVDIEPKIKVFADRKNIEEAMRNYINNAISHSKNNAEIIITLKRENRKVKLSVYNEGENISNEDLANIWDSFYKSDKSRTRVSSKNAGLGLYIVKLICQNNDASYDVENLENGVSFSIYLTTSS